ncbi:Coiled-coil domain-containing protein 25 [Zea mays]|uniref:Coiled-coil domain-containing protein 25 n=1 Tax=Zea mays TaxID=4577 RepID=A0A3L6FWX0_MAIZE|nr:Coiled-coil domain-containing protein 25 [Zea mays]
MHHPPPPPPPPRISPPPADPALALCGSAAGLLRHGCGHAAPGIRRRLAASRFRGYSAVRVPMETSPEMLSRREKATNFKPDYDIDIHMKVLAMSVQESSILTGYKMKVRTIKVEKRINEIVNRLNKTKVERKPDLKAEREAISAAEKAERKAQLRDKKRREEMERLDKEKQADIRSYKGLMVQEKMTSNKQIASGSKTLQELEEDFM